jgi:hypothetical protein
MKQIYTNEALLAHGDSVNSDEDGTTDVGGVGGIFELELGGPPVARCTPISPVVIRSAAVSAYLDCTRPAIVFLFATAAMIS